MSKSQQVHTLKVDGKKYSFKFSTLTSYIFSEKSGVPLEEMESLEKKLTKGKMRDQLDTMANLILSGIEAEYRRKGEECPLNKWVIIDCMGDEDFMDDVNKVIAAMGEDLPKKSQNKAKAKTKAAS